MSARLPGMPDPRQITETELQRALIEGLDHFGYIWNRVFRMQTKSGRWMTGTTLKGLPDLMAVGRGHTLWIEVKGPTTPIEMEQMIVLDRFAAGCPTNRCFILRPRDDMDLVVSWMRDPANAPTRYGWNQEMVERAAASPHKRTSMRAT